MTARARLCPNCGGLNSADIRECYRCKERLPAAKGLALQGFVRTVLGEGFPMTRLLVGFCLVVFTFSTLDAIDLGVSGFDVLLGKMRLSVALRFGALGFGTERAEPWRLLSAVFFHFGPLHLLFNLSALLHFGNVLERRVGSARLLCAFVLTGVSGFVLSTAWDSRVVTAGASGAVFGLSGVLAGHLYGAGDKRWKDVLLQALVMGLVVALALSSINNAAHLGGLVSGLPVGYGFGRERRPGRRGPLFSALALVLLLSSVASVVLSVRSPHWKVAREIESER